MKTKVDYQRKFAKKIAEAQALINQAKADEVYGIEFDSTYEEMYEFESVEIKGNFLKCTYTEYCQPKSKTDRINLKKDAELDFDEAKYLFSWIKKCIKKGYKSAGKEFPMPTKAKLIKDLKTIVEKLPETEEAPRPKNTYALNEIGSAIDLDTLYIYPLFKNDSLDLDNGTHISQSGLDDWWNDLSLDTLTYLYNHLKNPMRVEIELETASQKEHSLLEQVKIYVKHLPVKDVRDLAPGIKNILGAGYIVGTGGSHVWIHRAEKKNPLVPQIDRLAIIYQND